MKATGKKTRAIVFPIGGIGSGSIGLAGNGSLVDWEIFNRPNAESRNGFSHFAIRAQRDGKLLDARILNSDMAPPYTEHGGDQGPARESLGGLPHFPESEFSGFTPFATVSFRGSRFPGQATVTGWNPLIPLNDKDSSLPAAFFEISVENTDTLPVEYTVCQVVCNPYADLSARNTAFSSDGLHGVSLTSGRDKNTVDYGELTMATDAETVQTQEYWFRGVLYDSLNVYIRELTGASPLSPRHYDNGTDTRDHAVLAACFSLKPGEQKNVRFVLSWYMPNRENFWNPPEEPGMKNRWKNYYASLFSDSRQVAEYALRQYDRLKAESELFVHTLSASTMPEDCTEAIQCNLATLKTNTCMRLENGEFYGFEGCHQTVGSCEGSCDHVWNYAYALPYLFPKLERSMRELDYHYNIGPDGDMTFRLMLPLGRQRIDYRPCIDGQFGGVLKTYRDWKICGDTDWLRSLWPEVKASLAYAWSPNNPDRWDPEKNGMITGRQHNTLDAELFGPCGWMEGYYLAALSAASEMAAFLGDPDEALYRELLEKGKSRLPELFNGQYYIQKIDLHDPSVLNPYQGESEWSGKYWSDELSELRLQFGDGCVADQMTAQWHCDLSGLGDVFPPETIEKSLRSVFRYNFKESMRDEWNAYRLFAVGDEPGLIVCDWPEGHDEPMVPALYSHEVLGWEYAISSHMLKRGLKEEGLAILRGVRSRFDGEKRNPFNEFECGSHYARNLCSYAYLLVYSGFICDMEKRKLSFAPLEQGDCTYFWSMDSAWGSFSRKDGHITLSVLYGKLTLNALVVDGVSHSCSVELNAGEQLSF